MLLPPRDMYRILLGQDERIIKDEIMRIKRRISRLKREVVRENLYNGLRKFPSAWLQLYYAREELNDAMLALLDSGYQPTKVDERRAKFVRDLKNLKEIVIEIERFAKFSKTWKFLLNDSVASVEYRERYSGVHYKKALDKSSVIYWIEELHIEEWRKRYFAPVLDGESWAVELKFNDKSKKRYHGSNAYPVSYFALVEYLIEL